MWNHFLNKIASKMETTNNVQISGQKILLTDIQKVPDRYQTVFAGYPCFNCVQSKVFHDVFNTDDSIAISAPTGSGKTVLFELAIVRHLMRVEQSECSDIFKIVYISPMKALCEERLVDWHIKFSPYGIHCISVTGDSDFMDVESLSNHNLIITTPEKWDSLTRKWKVNRKLIEDVKLFMIDEIHLLNEENRGATLEVMVCRMKTIQNTLFDNIDPTLSKKNQIRFLAVSATFPNVKDLGEWLNAKYFSFENNARPVKLNTVILGYSYSNLCTPFKFDMTLTYKLPGLIMKYSNGKPTLVFCSTRKSVEMTAKQLGKMLTIPLSLDQRQTLCDASSSITDAKLKASIITGIGYHHGGLLPQTKAAIEQLFRKGGLPVLITTSTLATGVNLPAHLVIIKSTKYYDNGGYQDYTATAILQMIGRAGRPQFDSEATALILTLNADKEKFTKVIDGNQDIESNLHRHLTEHLNAEIVLGTITDLTVAIRWLSSTFLYIRTRENPRQYSIPLGWTKEKIERKLLEICKIDLNKLVKAGMIIMDEDVNIISTYFGELMAKYYISFESMKILKSITGSEMLQQVLSLISKCQEFSDMRLRVGEKKCLNLLNKNGNQNSIRFPFNSKITTLDMKVNCIIQAIFGCLQIEDHSIVSEAFRIMRLGERICRCLIEYLESRGSCYSALLNSVLLWKCFRCQLWENSQHVVKQFPGIGCVTSTQFVNAGKTSFEKIAKTNPRELEMIACKKPPFGNNIINMCKSIPKYDLKIEKVIENGEITLKIIIQLLNAECARESTVASAESLMSLLVGDNTNEIILHERYMLSYLLENIEITRFVTLNENNRQVTEVYVNFISEHLAGIDVYDCYSINNGTQELNKEKVPETPRKTKSVKIYKKGISNKQVPKKVQTYIDTYLKCTKKINPCIEKIESPRNKPCFTKPTKPIFCEKKPNKDFSLNTKNIKTNTMSSTNYNLSQHEKDYLIQNSKSLPSTVSFNDIREIHHPENSEVSEDKPLKVWQDGVISVNDSFNPSRSRKIEDKNSAEATKLNFNAPKNTVTLQNNIETVKDQKDCFNENDFYKLTKFEESDINHETSIDYSDENKSKQDESQVDTDEELLQHAALMLDQCEEALGADGGKELEDCTSTSKCDDSKITDLIGDIPSIYDKYLGAISNPTVNGLFTKEEDQRIVSSYKADKKRFILYKPLGSKIEKMHSVKSFEECLFDPSLNLYRYNANKKFKHTPQKKEPPPAPQSKRRKLNSPSNEKIGEDIMHNLETFIDSNEKDSAQYVKSIKWRSPLVYSPPTKYSPKISGQFSFSVPVPKNDSFETSHNWSYNTTETNGSTKALNRSFAGSTPGRLSQFTHLKPTVQGTKFILADQEYNNDGNIDSKRYANNHPQNESVTQTPRKSLQLEDIFSSSFLEGTGLSKETMRPSNSFNLSEKNVAKSEHQINTITYYKAKKKSNECIRTPSTNLKTEQPFLLNQNERSDSAIERYSAISPMNKIESTVPNDEKKNLIPYNSMYQEKYYQNVPSRPRLKSTAVNINSYNPAWTYPNCSQNTSNNLTHDPNRSFIPASSLIDNYKHPFSTPARPVSYENMPSSQIKSSGENEASLKNTQKVYPLGMCQANPRNLIPIKPKVSKLREMGCSTLSQYEHGEDLDVSRYNQKLPNEMRNPNSFNQIPTENLNNYGGVEDSIHNKTFLEENMQGTVNDERNRSLFVPFSTENAQQKSFLGSQHINEPLPGFFLHQSYDSLYPHTLQNNEQFFGYNFLCKSHGLSNCPICLTHRLRSTQLPFNSNCIRPMDYNTNFSYYQMGAHMYNAPMSDNCNRPQYPQVLQHYPQNIPSVDYSNFNQSFVNQMVEKPPMRRILKENIQSVQDRDELNYVNKENFPVQTMTCQNENMSSKNLYRGFGTLPSNEENANGSLKNKSFMLDKFFNSYEEQ